MKASFYIDFTNTDVKITRKEFDDDGELEVESHLRVDALREACAFGFKW